MRRLSAIVVALALVLVLPAGAAAAPPLNDLPGGATALTGTIPAPIAQDTTQATVSAADDVGCGQGGFDEATVWYTITPAQDIRLLVDTSGSDYRVGINLFGPGAPTPDTIELCTEVQQVANLTAGTTYWLMFADIDENGINGGQLAATFGEAPPPIDVTLTVDRVGKVVQRQGIVTLTGTITCSDVPDDAFIELVLRQRIGKYSVRGFSGFDGAQCGPEPFEWTAEFTGENGRFGGGKAEVDVFAAACDPLQCGEFQQTFSVRLRR
jgi:hypothetical protein